LITHHFSLITFRSSLITFSLTTLHSSLPHLPLGPSTCGGVGQLSSRELGLVCLDPANRWSAHEREDPNEFNSSAIGGQAGGISGGRILFAPQAHGQTDTSAETAEGAVVGRGAALGAGQLRRLSSLDGLSALSGLRRGGRPHHSSLPGVGL